MLLVASKGLWRVCWQFVGDGGPGEAEVNSAGHVRSTNGMKFGSGEAFPRNVEQGGDPGAPSVFLDVS